MSQKSKLESWLYMVASVTTYESFEEGWIIPVELDKVPKKRMESEKIVG